MVVLEALLCGVLITIITWYISYSWNRRHFYKLAAKIPGPKGLPFIGIALKFLGKDNKDILKVLIRLSANYGSPCKVWLGPVCFVIIERPEDMQLVLNSQNCIDKSHVYQFFGARKGLIVSGGNLWRTHRKLLNPTFFVKVINTFIPKFNETSKKMIDIFDRKYAGQKEFNAFNPISLFILETLLSTTIGLNKDVQNDENNKYLNDVHISISLLNERVFKVWLHPEPIFKLTKLYQKQLKHLDNGVLAIADEIIAEKDFQYDNKNKLKQHDTTNESIDEDDEKKPQIFIDHLFELRTHLGLDEIKDEINTIMAAGFDTTASTLSSLLLMLAIHQDVQDKVLDELSMLFDTQDQEVDQDKLNQMPYIETVIKETMRLFPILTVTARTATADVQLDNCIIPAGANLMLNVFGLHRNPKFWGEDAAVFRPDRFEPENFSKIHPYAFVPFSGGLRICLGFRYAMNLMKTALCYLLRHYKITSSLNYDEIDVEILLVTRIVQGYRIQLEKRKFKP
ncbi:unnamed protein product [Diamesa serratosioi]